MKWHILLMMVMMMIPLVSAVNYWDYLTKARADTLYCPIGGDCNMTSLTLQNLTVIGQYFNVTVTDIYINVSHIIDAPWLEKAGGNMTGNINMTGNDITDVGEMIVNTISIQGNFTPYYDDLYSIGNRTNRFREIWVKNLWANIINSTSIITDDLEAQTGGIKNITSSEINMGTTKIKNNTEGDLVIVLDP